MTIRSILARMLVVISICLCITACTPQFQTEPVFTDTSLLSEPLIDHREDIPRGNKEGQFGIINPNPTDDVMEPPSSPLAVRFLSTSPPKVNEAMRLRLEVHAYADALGTQVEVILPEGAELLAGSPQATLDIGEGETQELTLDLVFRSEGEYYLQGRAENFISRNLIWADTDSLFLTVGENFAAAAIESGNQPSMEAIKVSDTSTGLSEETHADYTATPNDDEFMQDDEAAAAEEAQDLATDDAETADSLESETDADAGGFSDDETLEDADADETDEAVTPEADESAEDSRAAEATSAIITVGVCWEFTDRDGNVVPLRDAYVQLMDKDSGTDDLLASGYTNSNGCRNFTINNQDTDVCCTVDVYARVFLSHFRRYRVMTYNGSIYNSSTSVTYNINSSRSLGTWRIASQSGNGRSAHIYDDLYRSRRFIMEQAVNRGMGSSPGYVRVLWQTGGTDGTYYSRADKHIHLEDIDASSRDVVVHEAAHRYMDAMYSNWPPSDCPSPHFITRSSGKHCAWTEGYTYVFVAAADGNPIYSFPGGGSVNLESPSCNSAGWDDGPTVEGRVGGVLIDLMDPFTLSFDSVNGFSNESVASCGTDLASGFFDGLWRLLNVQDSNLIVSQGGDSNSLSNDWENMYLPRFATHRVGHLNTIGTFTHD